MSLGTAHRPMPRGRSHPSTHRQVPQAEPVAPRGAHTHPPTRRLRAQSPRNGASIYTHRDRSSRGDKVQPRTHRRVQAAQLCATRRLATVPRGDSCSTAPSPAPRPVGTCASACRFPRPFASALFPPGTAPLAPALRFSARRAVAAAPGCQCLRPAAAAETHVPGSPATHLPALFPTPEAGPGRGRGGPLTNPGTAFNPPG